MHILATSFIFTYTYAMPPSKENSFTTLLHSKEICCMHKTLSSFEAFAFFPVTRPHFNGLWPFHSLHNK